MEIRSSTILRLRDALLESGARQGSVSSSAYRTLFSRKMLTKAENAAIERVAASAESMFLVIAADLQVTQSELIALRGAVRGLSSEVLSDDIVQLMMEQYADQLREDGLDQRLQAIAATLDATEAQNVFSLAAAVALADGEFVAEENAVIEKMKRAYGLTDAQVSAIIGELQQDPVA